MDWQKPSAQGFWQAVISEAEHYVAAFRKWSPPDARETELALALTG